MNCWRHQNYKILRRKKPPQKKKTKKKNRIVKVKNNLLELEKDFKKLWHGELKDR